MRKTLIWYSHRKFCWQNKWMSGKLSHQIKWQHGLQINEDSPTSKAYFWKICSTIMVKKVDENKIKNVPSLMPSSSHFKQCCLNQFWVFRVILNLPLWVMDKNYAFTWNILSRIVWLNCPFEITPVDRFKLGKNFWDFFGLGASYINVGKESIYLYV